VSEDIVLHLLSMCLIITACYVYMYSTQQGDNGGRSTRKRGRRGKPRKHTSIDDVTCEDPFALYLPGHSQPDNGSGASAAAGDGCYVSALIQNRKYYGVLFDQDALKAATKQHFMNEASSLELNNRMKSLASRIDGKTSNDADDIAEGQEPESKRQRVDTNTSEKKSLENFALEDDNKSVEKLRLIEPEGSPADKTASQPYRELVATYASITAASEDDIEKALLIQDACRSGGGWVGKYYYHYEDPRGIMNGVAISEASRGTRSYRLSMGIDAFLRNTALPAWYPLANLECGQSEIMNILNIKPDKKGGGISATASAASVETLLPMDQRTCFRVGVIGGGIAGLACAYELLRQSESEGLNMEIILIEARDRIGGRLLTDYDSFQKSDGSSVAVDLGASWIHGITDNPLTALSREANVDLVTSIEDVKMISHGMKEIDRSVDDKMGDLFDSLLDEGAAGCWKREETSNVGTCNGAQRVCRWYGSALGKNAGSNQCGPPRTSPPSHRASTDITIDNAVGAALKGREEFEHLSKQEHSLLRWYCENAQYALGADMKDLSMMFWESDETHAFEGDHVYIKQGYSSLVGHLLQKCEAHGDAFKLVRNFPVGKLEFARNSTSHPYRDIETSSSDPTTRIDLSDTCSATSMDGTSSYNFDFAVCGVPLGVLKDSVDSKASKSTATIAADSSSSDPSAKACDRLTFEPPLPFSKRDSIENVGFGLLNKVYLQFPTAFWRRPGDRTSLEGTPYLGKGSEIFGNASGHNAQHYMFLDVGRTLNRNDAEPPAILMTLISGTEAVAAERMSDAALIDDVVSTLKHLYSEVGVPSPTSVRITRWGGDEFSRGCYTFLPPGTSDQDYFLLQAPCNANGEAFMVDKSETMRLFFCGEHTTSLHPSMAHGAYLSGLRAAADVMKYTKPITGKTNQPEDMSIPISIYRQKNPHVALACNLCLQPGNRRREGALLAFQKGGRRNVAHSNCAASCPEVSLEKGIWKNVTRACARGSKLACLSCGRMGATIGCTFGNDACLLSYHFRCAEDTGWNFDRDGKAFFCDQHRMYAPNWSKLRLTSKEFFSLKNPNKPIICCFCKNGDGGSARRCGSLLFFRQGAKQILAHSHCLRHTNIVKTLVKDPAIEDDGDSGMVDEDEEDSLGDDNSEEEQYQNVFEAFSAAKHCAECGCSGATIRCSRDDCSHFFHLMCAEDATGWTFDSRKRGFVCDRHSDPPGTSDDVEESNLHASKSIGNLKDSSANPVNKKQPPDSATNGNVEKDHASTNGSKPSTPTKLPAFLQHDLFCKGAATIGNGSSSSHRSPRKRNYKPSNEYVFHSARDSNEHDGQGVEGRGTLSSNTEGDRGSTDGMEVAQAASVYERVLTERLAVDPHLANPLRFAKWFQTTTTAKRAGTTIPWNLQLSVVDHSVECTGAAAAQSSPSSSSAGAPTVRSLTLEVVGGRSDTKYCHGLEPGDVIVAIDGAKIGSDDLPNFVSVANLMRTGLELRLNLLRNKCIGGIDSPADPNK
jgi:monoamine oxidase